MFTEDIIKASVGFRQIETIEDHLSDLYQDTITLHPFPADAVLDAPVFCPSKFAEVMLMDILFLVPK
jgi:hypothetical protein